MNCKKLYPRCRDCHHVSTIWIFKSILIASILGIIAAIPAQATSLKNILFAEQLKPNKNENDNTSLNTQLLQLVPKSSKVLSKDPATKNELESHLLKEVKDTINEVKEADKITQETISGQAVYFYHMETTKPVAFSNNTNFSGTNQIRWRLSAPKQIKKVPEAATSVSLILAFVLFTARYKLKQVQKF